MTGAVKDIFFYIEEDFSSLKTILLDIFHLTNKKEKKVSLNKSFLKLWKV